jgi:hypothetical protein
MSALRSEAQIVDGLEREGVLWRDPDFGPESADERWLRPAETLAATSATTTLFAPSSLGGELDLIPGQTGAAWLLGALAALASRPSLLQHLFVSVRGRSRGLYTLQLFIGEAWVPITIDDRLPCDLNGIPLYTRSGVDGELWVPLVEKAFAKLLGGYGALNDGHLPHAFRCLTGGIPLELTLGAHRESTLTWDRLHEQVSSGSPVTLTRLATGSGDTPPARAAELTARDRGEMLHGLAYPVQRLRVADGVHEVEVSCPWAPWPALAAGIVGGGDRRGRWIAFDRLASLFDLANVASCARGEPRLASGSAGSSETPTDAACPMTLRLVACGEWPEAPRGTLLDAGSVPAFQLTVHHRPIMLVALLEQLLAPRARPVTGDPGIGLVLLASPFSGAPHSIGHTLPARPNRRVVLDVSTALPRGEYLILPHRIATAQVSSMGFRLEIEARVAAVGDDAGDSSLEAARGPAASLRAVPGGLPNRGGEVLDGVTEELAARLLSVEDSSEAYESGEVMRRQLEQMLEEPRRAKAASAVQRQIRGRLQRKELEELRMLQAGREAEEVEAAVVMQAGVRGCFSRRKAQHAGHGEERTGVQVPGDSSLAAGMGAGTTNATAGGMSLHSRLVELDEMLLRNEGGAQAVHLQSAIRNFMRQDGDVSGPDAIFRASGGTWPMANDEVEAARALQAGARGLRARTDVHQRRRQRAALALQASARGRSGRLRVRHAQREVELKRLRALEAFNAQTDLLVAREERLDIHVTGHFPSAPEAEGGLFARLHGDERGNVLRYVPAHVANAARQAVGTKEGGDLVRSQEDGADEARRMVPPSNAIFDGDDAALAGDVDDPGSLANEVADEATANASIAAASAVAAATAAAAEAAAAASAASAALAAAASASACGGGSTGALDGAFGGVDAPPHMQDIPPPLPSTPAVFLPDACGTKSNFTLLQQQQRSLVAALPLSRPDRVVRLLLEKDEALEALAFAHANTARGASEEVAHGESVEDLSGGDCVNSVHELFAEQRQTVAAMRVQYEASMRALAAELANQNCATEYLQAVERLSNALEATLSRVRALELESANGTLGRLSRRPVNQTQPASTDDGRVRVVKNQSSICTLS